MKNIEIKYNLRTLKDNIDVNKLKEKINETIISYLKDNGIDNIVQTKLNNTITPDGRFYIGDIYKVVEQSPFDRRFFEYYFLITGLFAQTINNKSKITAYRGFRFNSSNNIDFDLSDNILIDDILFMKKDFDLGYYVEDGKIKHIKRNVIKSEFVKRSDDIVWIKSY